MSTDREPSPPTPPPPPPSSSAPPTAASPGHSLGYGELLVVFLKAGLAFGGGLGILAVLEEELVRKRGLLGREEFLTTYALGRVVPSGTMTALAVAFGYRFGGLAGTVIALTGLTLPAFTLTVLLTIAYALLRGGPVLTLLPVTILPAAIAFIVAAALNLGRDVYRSAPALLLAGGAFVAARYFDVSPALILLAGGLAGTILFAREGKRPA